MSGSQGKPQSVRSCIAGTVRNEGTAAVTTASRAPACRSGGTRKVALFECRYRAVIIAAPPPPLWCRESLPIDRNRFTVHVLPLLLPLPLPIPLPLPFRYRCYHHRCAVAVMATFMVVSFVLKTARSSPSLVPTASVACPCPLPRY